MQLNSLIVHKKGTKKNVFQSKIMLAVTQKSTVDAVFNFVLYCHKLTLLVGPRHIPYKKKQINTIQTLLNKWPTKYTLPA